jgi:hypothetical protein
MLPMIEPNVTELVARFHGALISLERFDNEHVRPSVETKESHPPREFAIVSTYLRSLAHFALVHFRGLPFQGLASITTTWPLSR